MGFIKYILAFVTYTVLGQHAFSQTAKEFILTPEAFIQQVKLYHPVAKQANIVVDNADAVLLSAKGGFDPFIDAFASRKTFDGKNYYYYTNPELKIPTPIGIDIKTGLENNGGNFLNPEISTGRTSYVGLEVPLIKGLLIDTRRAVLQQAKIFQQQGEQERIGILNDLLFEAYTDYWRWTGAYQLYNLYSKFVDVANNRLRLVRIAFINGDRAMMDTIEAFTQVQNYQLQQSEASLNLTSATFEVSNYLWQPGDIPAQLPSQFVPDTIQFAMTMVQEPLNDLIFQSTVQNPVVKSYELKLNSLEVERKLKFQSLLPSLNLSANLLNKNYYALNGVDAALLQNNYKWGIEFKLPLFLREGRGAYRQAKLKIRDTDLELINKRWQIQNKIRTYYNENILLMEQLQTAQIMYNNYSLLLRNEELKFDQGESSLFLVNSREIKVLELLQKQVELRFKYLKSTYAIEWSAGLLR